MSRSDKRLAVLNALCEEDDLTPKQVLSKTKQSRSGPFDLFEVNGELYHLTTEGYVLRSPDDRGKGIHPKFRITSSGSNHLDEGYTMYMEGGSRNIWAMDRECIEIQKL